MHHWMQRLSASSLALEERKCSVLRESVNDMREKKLQLYIHIPFCVKKCQYCDFLSFPADESTQNAYVDALLREMAYYGPRCRDYVVTTVYIGGGTPSWLTETAIERIMRMVRNMFCVDSDAEVSIECNPGTVTDHKFEVYRRAGINRLSIGLQSASDDELKLLGRIHTYEQFLKTYELARKNRFYNINVDLMNSLPGQTTESFYHTLQQVLRLKPEHISAYSLIIEPGTPFYDLYKFDAVKQHAGMQTIALPTEDEVYQMTKFTEQVLKEAGYEHYEISNFAKPGFECRHNIGYWQRANYLGLGLGAASLMENIRYSNVTDLYTYLEQTKNIHEGAWEHEIIDPANGQVLQVEQLPATNLHASVERVQRKAQIEEFMFLGLRMIQGITREQFTETFGIQIEAVYQDVMQRLQEEGLLEKRAGRIYLTEQGQDVSNYALSQFLM